MISFSPSPSIPYTFIFQEKNSLLVETEISMTITFTEENNIYQVERCFGFTPYEGYDNHGRRFVCYVCYINNSIILNSCIALKYLLEKTDADDGTINSFDITKILNEKEVVYTL